VTILHLAGFSSTKREKGIHFRDPGTGALRFEVRKKKRGLKRGKIRPSPRNFSHGYKKKKIRNNKRKRSQGGGEKRKSRDLKKTFVRHPGVGRKRSESDGEKSEGKNPRRTPTKQDSAHKKDTWKKSNPTANNDGREKKSDGSKARIRSRRPLQHSQPGPALISTGTLSR